MSKKPISNFEADRLLEELFSSSITFGDYEESFYNEKEYEEEEYIEPMSERDLKGDI
ncbi:hypothetical protein [Romboutsia sp.]|uniref:hypothetical protein n=1 Tax=Romboutsia sp. TaxID=1965302 RepID=UPI002BF9BEE7|nr:hypothetical protein [Romboutsia sp.]HSQ88727.1 hypothetical protein [Romboutsia sp.]